MKNKFTILGCGSSLGSPWITNFWGNCNKRNKKNLRTRCCAHFQYKNISVLIDTSPDLKTQFKANNLDNVDAVIYTHEHADQTSGIFELRPFFWKNGKKIDIYGSYKTIKQLKSKYDFCFKPKQGYMPIAKDHLIKATAYVIDKVAYLSDCSHIPNKSKKFLYNLDFLIVDCLRTKYHPGHFNLETALSLSKELNPKKTILTNLHVELDYEKLKKKLPTNVIPAFDGMNFNF